MIPLPLSGLKRGEVYSFLGGLFASVPWIFFSINRGWIDSQNQIAFGLAAAFLWLGVTAISSVLNTLLYQILLTNAEYYYPCHDTDYHLADIGLPGEKLAFYEREAHEEMFIAAHIYTVMSSSILLMVFPASKLIFNEYLAFILFGVSSLFMWIGYRLYFRRYFVVFKLWQCGLLIFTSKEKVTEQGSYLLSAIRFGCLPDKLNQQDISKFRHWLQVEQGMPIIIIPDGFVSKRNEQSERTT